MSKWLNKWSLLALMVGAQLLLAFGLGLSHDEAYYWLYSKNLAWGYFDHPPMVGITIRLFSFLPHGDGFIRIGFILEQALALFFLWKIVPKEREFLATLLFMAFPLAFFTGFLALPDMPLLFFSSLYCYLLKKYLEEDHLSWALGLGVIIPGMLYAKYHGILLIAFSLLALPQLLKRKSFYLILGLSICLFLPHLLWQIAHDFSTLRYHFIERPKAQFSVGRIFEYLGLQVGIAGLLAGPLLWWTILKEKSGTLFDRAMKFNGIGIILFFLVSTFSKKFEANWSIPATIPLIYWGVKSPLWDKRWGKGLLSVSAALPLIFSLFVVMFPELVPLKRLNEFKGWREWSQKVQDRCGELPLVANTYQIASKLSFYLETQVPALNYRSRKNQFDYWKFEESYPEGAVCYVTDKEEFSGEEILTPEGKRFKMSQSQTVSELWARKAEQ